MAKTCATLLELLRFAPEFGPVGSKTFGTLELAVQPNPGEIFRIEDPFSIPPGKLELVAGTDFDIGVDTDETATNIAAALSGLVVGSADGSIVTIVSVASGAAALYPWSSEFGVLSPTTSLGTGDAEGPVPIALSTACMMLGPCCWGERTSTGTMYLAAHLLALHTGIGATGQIVKRKIDKIETQYNVTGVPSDKELGTTKYGTMYLALRRTVFIPGFVVGKTRGGPRRFGGICS